MKKGLLLFICVMFITVLSGCGEKQDSAQNKQDVKQISIAEQPSENSTVDHSQTKVKDSAKLLPVIDHLDTYPFPVLSGWIEEKFEVREYDEQKEWEAVFTFEGNEGEQALAYKEVIEDLGYETQTLMTTVFKIGTAEFAGMNYRGTFTFNGGDEYSEWGAGQGYVNITFSQK